LTSQKIVLIFSAYDKVRLPRFNALMEEFGVSGHDDSIHFDRF